MTKKYKLIREFPTSPSRGLVVQWGDHGLSGWCYEGKQNDIYRFSKECVENYPEFWEEIKEKEYKVISFLVIENSPKTYYTERIDCFGNLTGMFGPYDRKESLEDCIKKYKIYSVKRISDGEIFSIGDKIQNFVQNGKVSNIVSRISVNGDYVWLEVEDKVGGCILNCAKKVKEPLFITEDGKEIYNNCKQILYKVTDDLKIVCDTCIITEDYNFIKGRTFYFSENAEKYIEENKPQYSHKQVINILRGFDKTISEYEEINDSCYVEFINKYK